MRSLSIVGLTLFSAAIIAIGGGYWFIHSGIYNVSASTPDSTTVTWVVHTTSDNSVGARMMAHKPPPGLDAEAVIQAGGQLYAANCAVCHGGPGLVPSNIAKGINPSPPDLFRADREPSHEENFQFIKHGVKMTGMPAFTTTLTDTQLWSLVAFLDKGPKMTPDYYSTHTVNK